jgi:hypothetical protein
MTGVRISEGLLNAAFAREVARRLRALENLLQVVAGGEAAVGAGDDDGPTNTCCALPHRRDLLAPTHGCT